MSVSLANFDPCDKSKRINSPRSIEACKRQGIDPNELYYISKSEVAKQDKTANKKIIEIRYEHFEEKWKEKVRILLEEWDNVIKDEEEGLIEFDQDHNFYRSMHWLHTS